MEKGQYCQRWCVGLYFLFLVILVPNSTLGIEKSTDRGDTNWGVTQIKTITHNYLWTIENYRWHGKKFKEFLRSPLFSSPKNNSFQWQLIMAPMGDYKEWSDWISAYLLYASGPLPFVEASYEVRLVGNFPDKKYRSITDKKRFERGDAYGTSGLVERAFAMNPANGVIVDDKVQIFTEFTFYATTKIFSGDCNMRGENDLGDQFSDHLEPLLENGLYSDVAIMVRGQRFPAHKVILAAQSSVFAGLFVNEVTDSTVQAIDVDPNVMKEALRYLYTGRVRNLESISKELLQVASAYKIGGLQALCEESICNSLIIENPVSVLGLAESYNDNKLKSKAIEFIAAHADELMYTDKFKSFQNSHPFVTNEILNVRGSTVE